MVPGQTTIREESAGGPVCEIPRTGGGAVRGKGNGPRSRLNGRKGALQCGRKGESKYHDRLHDTDRDDYHRGLGDPRTVGRGCRLQPPPPSSAKR